MHLENNRKVQMSKQLMVAVSKGIVKVRNKTAGEVAVFISTGMKETKKVSIPPYGQVELSPKHIPLSMVDRITNLKDLIRSGALSVL